MDSRTKHEVRGLIDGESPPLRSWRGTIMGSKGRYRPELVAVEERIACAVMVAALYGNGI
jgi:hypothetical protein